MFSFLQLAKEKIKTTFEETIETLNDKREDIIDSLSSTKEKVVTTLKTGKDKFIDVISTTVEKIKDKIDNNSNETIGEYDKEKYEKIGHNKIYTSDESWGICPITQNYMENPVIIYEKKAILDWIKRNPTDPITREKLTPNMLVEDKEYRNAIREYRKSIEENI